MLENLTHNEDTVAKIYRVLIQDGHHTQSEAAELVGQMQNAGILFRERSDEDLLPDGRVLWTQGEKDDFEAEIRREERAYLEESPTVNALTAEDDRWFIREVRAKAMDHAIRAGATGRKVVPFAKEIEDYLNYTPGNKDLNDVAAQDTFYLVLGELIGPILADLTAEIDLGEFLIDCVDKLAKAGVRLKDGQVLTEE